MEEATEHILNELVTGKRCHLLVSPSEFERRRQMASPSRAWRTSRRAEQPLNLSPAIWHFRPRRIRQEMVRSENLTEILLAAPSTASRSIDIKPLLIEALTMHDGCLPSDEPLACISVNSRSGERPDNQGISLAPDNLIHRVLVTPMLIVSSSTSSVTIALMRLPST